VDQEDFLVRQDELRSYGDTGPARILKAKLTRTSAVQGMIWTAPFVFILATVLGTCYNVSQSPTGGALSEYPEAFGKALTFGKWCALFTFVSFGALYFANVGVKKRVIEEAVEQDENSFTARMAELQRIKDEADWDVEAGDLRIGESQLYGFDQEREEMREGFKRENSSLSQAELDYEVDNLFSKAIKLKREERNRHLYIIGKTRMGKTSLMLQMARQDILRGQGICFIDPHGDASELLLDNIPEERLDDVIYFDPTKLQGVPSFNPFALSFPPAKLTEDIVSVFHLLVGEQSWGPRMEHLLRYGVLTLVTSSEPHTLRDLRSLYIDESKRDAIIETVANPSIREFWHVEYATIPSNAVNPILNKLSAFLSPTSDLERIFSNPINDIDFTEILNGRKIFIVNLAKGILGDEPSRLLGGLIVTGLQQATLGRANIPESQRTDFYLYVDEFQNFTVASFPTILAESAKYRLNLTLAHQNLAQVSTHLQRSIFGNCGTMIAFQISAQDGALLSREMSGGETLVRNRNEGARLTLDGFRTLMQNQLDHASDEVNLGLGTSAQQELDHARAEVDLAETPRQIESATHKRDSILTSRYEYLAQARNLIWDPNPNISALQEMFPDYVFETTEFPTPSDFTNVPQFNAIIKRGFANQIDLFNIAEPIGSYGSRDAVTKLLEQKYLPAPEPVLTTPQSTDQAYAETTTSEIDDATQIEGPYKPMDT